MERPAAPDSARYRLGDYQDYAPPAPLAHVAEGVWIHRIALDAPLAQGAMHRVLPDPALSIAFRCRRDAAGRPVDPELVAIGPKTRPHIFRFARGREIAAVRLKLEWVEPLFGLVPTDHHDTERNLSGIYPFACALFDRLVESRSCSEAAATLARAVARRSRDHVAPRTQATAWALELVRRTSGAMPVDGIARATGRSVRHLRRTVRREAGISLKAYARVTRLLQAVSVADRSGTPGWARIAVDTGFCDQSHLIRECRALTGLSPGELHRERWAEAETSNPG
ncbi:MAG: helix-turn-helix domain-containing protein [Gemmatimonadales bacterium]